MKIIATLLVFLMLGCAAHCLVKGIRSLIRYRKDDKNVGEDKGCH